MFAVEQTDFPTGQTSWLELASRLAGRPTGVITFGSLADARAYAQMLPRAYRTGYEGKPYTPDPSVKTVAATRDQHGWTYR